MKRSLHNILTLMLAAAALVSCNGKISQGEQIFIDMTDNDESQLCVVKDGHKLEGLVYDENNYQLGYNPSTRTYKMIKDDGSYYYLVTCDSALKVGKKVKASVKYTTSKDVVTMVGVKFDVIDMNPYTGIIRLWNESAKLGISVLEVR
ncbi:MAG: hypothetical protein MJY56_05780 [Bacteroidales bacterium]|nr:hypothetical protein [Bacteroidales bacterium]